MGGQWMMGARWMTAGRWMATKRSLMVGAVALLASCGIDPDDSGVFGFSGSWTLTPATGLVLEPCAFELRDSKGTARCTGRRVEEFGADERYTDEITLNADAVLTETLITLDATWTRIQVEAFGDQEYRRACTLTISGRAEREAGRQDDGRFEAVAGTWTGSARYIVNCERGGEFFDDTIDLRFSADIFGNAAEIGWRELAQEFENTVAVQHFDGEGVRIEGVEVPEVQP